MRFTKMEGLGNDYVYVNCLERTPENLPNLAIQISDRHFGVGADGLICICPSEHADVRMRMFNADGSEGEMCGNGIRCVGKYVYDKGIIKKTTLTVETRAGVKPLKLMLENGLVSAVTVDMGKPDVRPPTEIAVKGNCYTVNPASMGNPHAVVYLPEIGKLDLKDLGPYFECHPLFPNRTNTEFVEIGDRTHLNMRVWERGSGETLACGTGACAVLAVTASLGLCEREAVVRLLGGELSIRWSEEDGHIYMTGPAKTVFEGELTNQ
ncbi:MAG: diaminopimelate epimerase [Oscillospiraceae bacterium]